MKSKVLSIVLSLLLLVALTVSSIVCAPAPKEQPVAPVEPIVFGVPVPRAAEPGQNVERSTVLAADEINAAGGIQLGGVKRLIKLEIIDDRDQEPATPISDMLLANEKLILDKGVKICIGGPALSEGAVAALDLYAKHKVLHLITTGAATPAWDKKVASDREQYKYSFNLEAVVFVFVEQVGDLCKSLKEKYGLDRMYIDIADTGYARAALPLIKARAAKDGFQLVGEAKHPLGCTDYSASLTDCKAKGGQILYVFDQQATVAIMASQWYNMKVPALLVGFIGPLSDPAMWEQTGGNCEYVCTTTSAAGSVEGLAITPMTKPFYDAYKAKWGVEGRAFGYASSYNGMYALKSVIESTQSLDPAVLSDALAKIDMVCINGKLRFDENHRAIYGYDPSTTLIWGQMQWQAGKRIAIWPPVASTGEVKLPPWMKK